MRLFTTFALTTVLSVGSAAAQTADQLSLMTLSFDVSPAHGLPGISPTIRIDLANAAAQPIALQDIGVCLEATGADGSQFAIGCDAGSYASIAGDLRAVIFYPGSAPPAVRIAARSTYTAYIPADVNGFFVEAPLLAPGRYDLRARLNVGGIRSNVVTYVVDAPAGANQSVWAVLQARDSASRGLTPFLDTGLYDTFAANPTSDYAKIWRHYQYLTSSLTAADRVGWLQQYVGSSLPPAWDTLARGELAGAYDALAESLAKSGDVAGAVLQADSGGRILRDLAAAGGFSAALAEAYTQQGLWTREQLQKLADAQTPRKTGPIIPHADCVMRNADGSYTVWFGYTNTNDAIYGSPVGPNNTFVTSPAERGQPTSFSIGKQERVFSIKLNAGEQATWLLYGKPAVANAEGSRKNCDDDGSSGSGKSK